MSDANNRKAVYTVIERDGGAKARWVRIGIAFVNKDGSLNVVLDALPVLGTLHIRDFPPRDEAGEEAEGGATPIDRRHRHGEGAGRSAA